jgi:hypothetical protein
MANLHSRTGAILHEDPEYGRFEPDDHGAFAFPDDLSDRLLRQHVRKKRMWEDEEMQAGRLHQEAEMRQRDPAVLYGAVSELVQLSRQAQGAAVPADLAAELAELRRELAELRESAGAKAAPKPAPAAKAADAR